MYLTDEQQAILNGAKGETMAKVMKTLVMYGEAFHADKMVPVTSDYNHLVTSFGLKMMAPVFDLMQQLIDADGWGEFRVDGGSVSTWVTKEAYDYLETEVV